MGHINILALVLYSYHGINLLNLCTGMQVKGNIRDVLHGYCFSQGEVLHLYPYFSDFLHGSQINTNPTPSNLKYNIKKNRQLFKKKVLFNQTQGVVLTMRNQQSYLLGRELFFVVWGFTKLFCTAQLSYNCINFCQLLQTEEFDYRR